MAHEQWKPDYTERSERFWQEYQATHDVSDRIGQAVGIDPVTGKVWFGESSLEIHHQQELDGETVPLLFLRVGKTYYGKMVGKRRTVDKPTIVDG